MHGTLPAHYMKTELALRLLLPATKEQYCLMINNMGLTPPCHDPFNGLTASFRWNEEINSGRLRALPLRGRSAVLRIRAGSRLAPLPRAAAANASGLRPPRSSSTGLRPPRWRLAGWRQPPAGSPVSQLPGHKAVSVGVVGVPLRRLW